jgi:helicase
MAFRGLFIGIDRYQSAAIGELNCARRDAMALNGLFTDTLGGVSSLLTDAEATSSQLKNLKNEASFSIAGSVVGMACWGV